MFVLESTVPYMQWNVILEVMKVLKHEKKQNEKKNDKDQKLTWSCLHIYNQEDMVISLFFIDFLLQFVLPFWNLKEFWP